MIETNRPTSVMNIEGELLRAAPITSRRLFSDALDMAPGVGSRNVDDGVGRRAYYFRGSHIYAHAFQLEGMPASAYIDSAAHSMGMGGDTVQDVEIKLGGADASTPLSTGVVMNIVTPRGQNEYKGSVAYAFQPMEWNATTPRAGPRRAACRRRSRSTSGTCRSAAASSATGCGSSPPIAMPTGERHQPHAAGPRVPDGVQARFRAVRQLLEEQAAVREGHRPAERQPRALGLLPERPQPLHQLSRAQHRPRGLQLGRRIDVSRQAEFGLGPTS